MHLAPELDMVMPDMFTAYCSSGHTSDLLPPVHVQYY